MTATRWKVGRRSWAVLAAAVLVLLGGWLLGGLGEEGGAADPAPLTASATPAPARSAASGHTQSTAPGGLDPVSGLVWIAAADLPPEAHETLELIDRGGPFPYAKDGSTFNNFEGILPAEPRGFYREYTVDTPGSRDRGARRIVTGDHDRIRYWTNDHYETFMRIRR